MAAAELKEQYSHRRIEIMDTLAASAGGGLMVYMAAAQRNAGASLEGIAAYLRSLTSQHCIWFMVDELECLKRGGRTVGRVRILRPGERGTQK